MTTRYDVTIYCPDQHLVYDGRTADRQGVGGGVTARIRLARALAALGHRVTMCVNCPREGAYSGVRYLPWQSADRIRTDILVLNTSGGALDLRPILAVDVQARRRIVWVQGGACSARAPRGRPGLSLCPQQFHPARGPARVEGGALPRRSSRTTLPTALDHGPALAWRMPSRDPYRLVYTSHPSKGLEAAIGVLRVLRKRDVRYHLHVYGGARLWGQEEHAPPPEDGLFYHGLTGQARLARALRHAGISLNLQEREEPLPLAAIEAMRAGCVVLASPVGGYPEIVQHGHNGFLVPGSHLDEATWHRTADLVSHLVEKPAHARYLRHNAQRVPWDWATMALTWSGHWDWILGHKESGLVPGTPLDLACAECGGAYLPLADGYHCTRCGFYTQGC